MTQPQAEYGIDPQAQDRIAQLVEQLRGGIPDALMKAIARSLHITGGRFKEQFRAGLSSKFKVGGVRVGGAFKSYVFGNSLDSLRLSVFTDWRLARLYEFGGTITPQTKSWLAIPVSPRAFDAAGRVLPTWREDRKDVFGHTYGMGNFNPQVLRGLVPVKVRGGWLLILPKEGGHHPKPGGKPIGEAMFLLVKSTTRAPVLRFLEEARKVADLFGPIAIKLVSEHLERAALAA